MSMRLLSKTFKQSLLTSGVVCMNQIRSKHAITIPVVGVCKCGQLYKTRRTWANMKENRWRQ